MALTKLTDLQPLHVHSIGISTFDGSVSVGGTLTYEDVTNVDAIGVVTARTGIKVLGGGANVVGVVTATAFHGDGSNLTGIAADKIFEGNTEVETVDTGSDGHIKFVTEGSERVRVKSNGYVGIGTNNPQRILVLSDDGAAGAEFNLPDNFGGLSLNLYNRTTTGFHPLSFNASDIRLGINAIEKVRLASTGQFLVGTSTPSGYSNRLLTVNTDDGDAHIEIRTANDHAGAISFSDTNAGNANAYSGFIQYDHANNRMMFGTSSTERFRILSGGEFAIGGGGYAGQPFSVQTSSVNLGYMQSTGTTRAVMNFVDGNSSVNVGYGCIGNSHVFMKDGSEKVRIDNSGNLCVGITGGSAKFHTKGDQSGGLIKCDAAEGTVRFFLTGMDNNACELNMYDDAGVQSTIIKAAASNKSTDIHTTQAGGRFRVYVTPLSGRTYRSSIFRSFEVDEYGEAHQERGSEGWTSFYRETNNGGQKIHCRHAYTGASSANVNLIRVRRHYWGAGNYKFIVKNTYYGGSYESHFWLNGHAAHGNTTSFNISHNNMNSGNANWIQKTATSHSAPGNNYSGWTDVFISIPAYHYFDIRIETSLMSSHSYDLNSIGNDGYALHPFS